MKKEVLNELFSSKLAEDRFCADVCTHKAFNITVDEARKVFCEAMGSIKENYNESAFLEAATELMRPYKKEKHLDSIKSIQDLIDFLKITVLSDKECRKIVLLKTGVEMPLGINKKGVIQALENTRDDKPVPDINNTGGFFSKDINRC